MMIEQVVSRQNMLAAYQRVVRNRGSAGVDGVTVEELAEYSRLHWERIRSELLEGRYQPQPVRMVMIPKPGGGERALGIPTVMDRMIQQAMHQVMTPLFDGGFSAASYGFRPGRSAHQAVERAREHMASGYRWVVDIDLERFFDRVNHDVLIARVSHTVKDKRVLGLIGRYLRAGLMMGGVVSPRSEGTPQGGPLSPLLSNILLDVLDKELEHRGHRFVRYADDCNVYVQSRQAGERVMKSLQVWLEKRLRLKINQPKSAVDRPWHRTFLGYSVTTQRRPRLKVSQESVKRMKQKLRELLRKGRGRNLRTVIATVAVYLRGWLGYYRKAEVRNVFEDLDKWLRRKLRRIVWKQWKKPWTRYRKLRAHGIEPEHARRSAWNGRGPWFNAGASHMHFAIPTKLLRNWGLPSLLDEHQRLQNL
jgi:RNA-directed DNA polymerase